MGQTMGKTIRSMVLAVCGGAVILGVAWGASKLPQGTPGKPAEAGAKPPTLPLSDMASWLRAKFGVRPTEPQHGSEERAKVERDDFA